jgi:hypothetical protein
MQQSMADIMAHRLSIDPAGKPRRLHLTGKPSQGSINSILSLSWLKTFIRLQSLPVDRRQSSPLSAVIPVRAHNTAFRGVVSEVSFGALRHLRSRS